MAAAAILFLMDPSQKRSSEMPSEPSYQIGLHPTAHKLLCQQASWVAILENGRLWPGAKRKYI